MLDAEDMDCSTGTYHVAFFRCHPDDMHKSHDTARWWPDWYEIVSVDKTTKTSFDYGQAVLVRPNRKPDITKHCRFCDTISLPSNDILLVGPFNFAAKNYDVRAYQVVPIEQWEALASA